MGQNSDDMTDVSLSDDAGREGDLFGFDEQEALGGMMATIQPQKRKGPGRPKGSPNRRTADLVKYIQANYRDPLLGFVDTANMDTIVLAKALGCKPIEALKAQISAGATALPYLHQKQATAVQVTGDVLAPFVVNLPEVTMTAAESRAHLENLNNSMTYEAETDIVGKPVVGTDD